MQKRGCSVPHRVHGVRPPIFTRSFLLILAPVLFLALTPLPAHGQAESLLYSFTNPTGGGPGGDGSTPISTLVQDASGNLYGVTNVGGTYGYGTVFELVNSSGTYTEKLLYSFTGTGGDGANPEAGVIMDSSGNLYGTTTSAGAGNNGTVYELVNSSGTYTEKVLYSFKATGDGAAPASALLMDSSGNLFGATAYGGTGGFGTVYELVNSSGTYTEKILHNFQGGVNDGANPQYPNLVMDSAGDIFGVTNQGGTSNLGVVYELVNSSGTYTESILHNFAGGPNDGANCPYAGLFMDAAGNLYGTTYSGGANGNGTVFEMVNSSGTYTEKVLYSFGSTTNDGLTPYSGVVMDSSGNIFGTTYYGGGTSCGSGAGCGTIYELVNSSGTYTERVVHAFAAGTTDGQNPYIGSLLLDSSGYLYGGTLFGGTSNPLTDGTIFRFDTKLAASSIMSPSSSSLSFGFVPIGGSPVTQSVTLTNTGGSGFTLNPVTIQPAGAPGFSIGADTCSNATVAAGSSCTVRVTFSPTAVGGSAGTLVFSSSGAANSPQDVSLSGYGVEPAQTSTSAVLFGNQVVNTMSGPQSVTLTNFTASGLTISSITATAPFSETNNCPSATAPLASLATCRIRVTFTPTAAQVYSGTLTINDGASNSPQVVALTGTGIASSGPATCPVISTNFFEKLPLVFAANGGQTDSRVKFISRGNDYELFLTPQEAVLSLGGAAAKGELRTGGLSRGQKKTDVVRMALVGGNSNPRVVGLNELPGKSNYLLGNDPRKWRKDVPNYAKVEYQDVYPGVNLIYHGNQRHLEYDFVVAPGADPGLIRLRIAGKDSKVAIARNGDLVIRRRGGELRFLKPVVYQTGLSAASSQPSVAVVNQVPAGQRDVNGSFVLLADNQVGFRIGRYDASEPLVIDPVLAFSTYLGGSADDQGFGIGVDSACDVYVSGTTRSADFPTTSGANSANLHGAPYTCQNGTNFCTDVFVTKLSPDGSTLLYSTYLGGADKDENFAMAVDPAGNAYLTGDTRSTNFPVTTGAAQGVNNGAPNNLNAYVAKLSPDGATLLYSTYLGGSASNRGSAIAVDSSGNAYVAGGAEPSSNFPVSAKAYRTTFASGVTCSSNCADAFVTEVNSNGTGFTYSTLLGGTGDDIADGIALDSSGDVYVTGTTASSDFPKTAGVVQPNYGGGTVAGGCASTSGTCGDAFVTELNSTGSGLVFSTYLGGSGDETGRGITLDGSGNIFVSGMTNSTNFPTTSGAFQTAFAGGSTSCLGLSICGDAFVTKLSSGGTSLLYSTYLGGSGDDAAGFGLAVDANGNAYVVGGTNSYDFPVQNPIKGYLPGGSCGTSAAPFTCHDGFVTKLDSGGDAPIFSDYLGGSGDTAAIGAILDSSDYLYVTGIAGSSDFPGTSGAFQTKFSGPACLDIFNAPCGDAFATKLANLQGPAVTLTPAGGLNFGNQQIGTTSSPLTLNVNNTGDGPLTISTFFIQGGFAIQSNNCPVGSSTLAAGASCAITVTFTPTVAGTDSGLITVVDDAYSNQHIATLTGTGAYSSGVSALSATTLNFPSTPVGSASAAQTLTLTNKGTGPLGFISFALTGDFAETNNCPVPPATLAVNGNCTVTLTFNPLHLGTLTGTLTETDDSPASGGVVSLSGTGGAVPFANGDIFIGVESGLIQRRTSTGALMQDLDSSQPSSEIAGMAFDTAGNLYATAFQGGIVPEFDGNGVFLKNFAAESGSHPESIVFDSAGNAYVGTADGDTTIKKYDSSGNLLASYAAAVQDRGTDWIDLASDQCTIFYTSEGTSIKRFNVCTNTQLSDFATGLPGISAYELRIRPNGEVLVADSTVVVRLDSSGNIIQTYTGLGAGSLFGLNLDPDGTSFWTADLFSGDIYKVDIATGKILLHFTDGAVATGGLMVKGEIQVATAADLALAMTASPSTVPVNSNVTYTLTATNAGPGAATNVTFTDTLPSGLTYVSAASSAGTCSGTATVTCNVGTIANGGTATVTLVATATAAAGSITNNASVSSDVADPAPTNNTATAAVTMGGPIASLSASTLALPNTPLNLICHAVSVTLTNTGTAAMTVNGITTSGEFTETDTCPASLGAGASCTISVTFHPTATGVQTGTLTIADNAPGSPQTVSLAGTGEPQCTLIAAASATTTVLRGSNAASYRLTHQLCTGALSENAVNFACQNQQSAQCSFNPTVVPPSSTTDLTVSNLRSITGNQLSFNVHSSLADGSNQRDLGLLVLFTDFSVTPLQTTETIQAGGSADYALLVAPVNGLEGSVSLSCSGAPAGSTCAVSPSSVQLAGTTTQVHVTVSTTARSGLAPKAGPPSGQGTGWLWLWSLMALLGGAGLYCGGRRRWAGLSIALAMVVLWAACGGGGGMHLSGGGGTPAGAYTLTIHATYTAPGSPATAVNHDAHLALTVN